MEKIFDSGKMLEVKVGGSFVVWVRSEDPKEFSVCREGAEKYVRMGWNELTLDEQNAVEKFN